MITSTPSLPPFRSPVLIRYRRFRLQDHFLRFQQPHGFLHRFDELRVAARDDVGRVLHHLDVGSDTFAFHGPLAVKVVEAASWRYHVAAVDEARRVPGAHQAALGAGADQRPNFRLPEEVGHQVPARTRPLVDNHDFWSP